MEYNPYSPTYVLGQIVAAFQPAFWGILYQVPLACLGVYLGLRAQVEDRPTGTELWRVIAMIGGGATVVFQLVLWILPGIIGLLVAAVGTYVLVMVAFDKLLGLHLEQAHSVTSFVCGVTLLLWFITGMAVVVARALSAAA